MAHAFNLHKASLKVASRCWRQGGSSSCDGYIIYTRIQCSDEINRGVHGYRVARTHDT